MSPLIHIVFYFMLFSYTRGNSRCNVKEESVKFYRIRQYHKSKQLVIARGSFRSVRDCQEFARDRRAFAFNYRLSDSDSDDTYRYVNCEIIACPEFGNFSTLVNNSDYDYYSTYGNADDISNATCLSSLGLFQFHRECENYANAIKICKEEGGILADILSEARTNALSDFIDLSLESHFKAAYVGLDDAETEGCFITSQKLPIACFKYRAWAPGHPRSKHRKDDCVVLDSKRMWRVINCKIKMPFVCELSPGSPMVKNETEDRNSTCTTITDKDERRECEKKRNRHEAEDL